MTLPYMPYLIAVLFLPLFPFSIIYTHLFNSQPHWLRFLSLLIWPQLGLLLISYDQHPLPGWLIPWALGSSIFYAYRTLAVREAGLWISFLACSAWPLLWIDVDGNYLTHLHALGLSLPLALMSLLVRSVEHRFGATHVGLDLRLGVVTPRLAGLVGAAIFAAVATPVSPNFFVLLAKVKQLLAQSPIATLIVLLVWLLWTWSGALLMKGLIVGPHRNASVDDLKITAVWAYTLAFILIATLGVVLGVLSL